MGQYTIVAQQKAKTMDGMMRPRSKDPPMTSCTVQAQKSIWYKPIMCQQCTSRPLSSVCCSQKTISGKKADPGDGADMTFFNPKLSMLPMKALAVREYASE
jgi:hypothetical protein